MSIKFFVIAIFFLLNNVSCINLQLGNKNCQLSTNRIKNNLLDLYSTLNIFKSEKYLKDSIKKINLYAKLRKRLYKDRVSVFISLKLQDKFEEVPIKVIEEKKIQQDDARENDILDKNFINNFIQFNKNNFFCVNELGLDINIPLLKNSNFSANIVYQLPKVIYVNAYANAFNSIIKGEFNTVDIIKKISFFQFFDNFYINANYDFKNKKALLNLESKFYEFYNKFGDSYSFNNKIIIQRDSKNQYNSSVCLSLKYNNNVFTPIFNFIDKSYEYSYDNLNETRKFSVKIDKEKNVHFNYLSFDKVNENNKYYFFFNFIFSNPMQSIITLKREYIF